MSGFYSSKRPTLGGAFSLEDVKNLLKKTQKRVTIKGFADRSVAKASGVKLLVFFKNIQPISVGV